MAILPGSRAGLPACDLRRGKFECTAWRKRPAGTCRAAELAHQVDHRNNGHVGQETISPKVGVFHHLIHALDLSGITFIGSDGEQRPSRAGN